MDDTTLRHEGIHSKQCIELLGVGFYIIYVLEWLVRLAIERDNKKAYRKISFEQEAYDNQYDADYKRKPFAMWRKKK